ncbi:MAG: ferritin-like domain-containing protein [Bacteroidota bacterium]|nr:ferritin-like domain-containing protein [Bacteroidota bacterium]
MEKKSKKTATSSKGKSAARNVRASSAKTVASKSHASINGKSATDSDRKSKVPSNGNSRSVAATQGTQLKKFFLDELKDLYWAEKHLVKALAKMAKEATTQELKEAFLEHRSETEDHVSRLEEVFEMVGEKPEAKKCDAMDGITREVDGIIEDTKDDTYTRDVALIIGAQKAEHYEIASYGGLIQLAMLLGHDDAAELMLQTLDEEKTADSTLTSIAENKINAEALTE